MIHSPGTEIEGAARRTAAPSAGRSIRCGRCRHEHAPEAWAALEVVDRITADGVRSVVTVWPDGVGVEIRRCRACGASMARKQAHVGPTSAR